MSTTALIIEILVIGIQSGVAILLWAIGILGYGVLHKPLFLLDVHGGAWRWMPIIALVMLAACYTLGILVDRISMAIFDKLVRPILRALCPPSLRAWSQKKVRAALAEEEAFVRVLSEEGELSGHLQDFRSRQRIARATVFNLILICLAFLLTPHMATILPKSERSMLFVQTLGGILLVMVIIAWAMLHVTYQERLKQVEEIRSRKR